MFYGIDYPLVILISSRRGVGWVAPRCALFEIGYFTGLIEWFIGLRAAAAYYYLSNDSLSYWWF